MQYVQGLKKDNDAYLWIINDLDSSVKTSKGEYLCYKDKKLTLAPSANEFTQIKVSDIEED